ncbi:MULTISPECIES: Crp/Fnr family transcriptional regulator [Chryseobacterium]|uniref:CRP-like cAMP-binding protein n=1 Tax=Chryseobacterium camelliae TaxID=1265445 RepID=A0ABU0TL23_9FLAO|nr:MULTISPECIES: Crp/Fnr family transcriptional regulator [Chryseobacterium]MDT3409220.1 CRP-like cAMP-binding protein [Pseudacidovorax intermedius]MDQ1096918.1 CRP-like cAMP-binding protein [Chryseobacterium camelliae]MDQ1100860.1 CRP-like cAMP-binding protein [Chryseobacterium sp. SORGH_AS_1048]MDR6084302.1 CRP-like cAMP-binding protein [Chryseobacterium sp. SORGH_AS_0909]MDR6132573.1 CRP-like cAMP-binding protein [Chryseobacterium sp. SORGH_AS_1175]
MEKLLSTLAFGGILSDRDLRQFASYFEEKVIKAGDFVQRYNDIAREVAFVEKGILRMYSPQIDGHEVTKYFIREGQFTVDLESYYTAKASTESIQCVTDCTIYLISKTTIEKLSNEIPNLYIYIKTITEMSLLNKIKDNDFLNFGDAKTKYCEFIRRYPDLALLVPQQYIASYLKITSQSLSRIRRNLK